MLVFMNNLFLSWIVTYNNSSFVGPGDMILIVLGSLEIHFSKSILIHESSIKATKSHI